MHAKRHLLIVVALLGLSCLVQVVAICRATTTSLDAVRFVAMARSIDEHGLLPTVRMHRQQPLYPAWVWVVHEGLLAATGEYPSAWATAAVLAAAAPLVLAVVPLYLLLLRLVGPAAAAAGSFFFCLVPEVSRLGADGLSDSTHLLFVCIAFWAIAEYLGRREAQTVQPNGTDGDDAALGSCRFAIGEIRVGRVERSEPHLAPGESPGAKWIAGGSRAPSPQSRAPCSPLWLLLAGLATAVATLARVEVLVLAAALGLTLAVFQLLPGRRAAWGGLAAASACFVLGLTVVWGPYLAVTGALTPPSAVARILGRHRTEPSAPQMSASLGQDAPGTVAQLADSWRLPDGEAMSFDRNEPSTSSRRRGYAPAVIRFGRKLAHATGYWIGALALCGAWCLPRTRAERGQAGCHSGGATACDRFAQVFFVLFSLVAIRFSAVEGYLVPRHLLMLVVPAMGAAGCGALELGSRLGRFGQRRTQGYSASAWALVAVAGICCLPQSLTELHHNHLGHRGAAQWLAAQTDPSDAVLDTCGWTGLYSGRETFLYEDAGNVLADPHLVWLVLEDHELQYDSRRSRTLRWLIDSADRPAGEFPEPANRRPDQGPVLVYRLRADRFPRQAGGEPLELAQAGETRPRGAGATMAGGGTGIAAAAKLDVHSPQSALRAVASADVTCGSDIGFSQSRDRRSR